MQIVPRIQAILLRPKEEWVRIKAEPTTAVQLFTSYVIILAALPIAFQFLGRVFIEKLPMIGHWPVGRALVSAAVAYVLGLATVYLFALVIRELAPGFSSSKNMTGALKLSAYSMTPAWLAGILNIVPGWWALSLVASLYGFYLLYLGLDTPVLDTPKERVPSYFAVCILVAIGLYVVVNLFLRIIFAFHYGQI
jgi:hypothetical protein